MLRYLSSHKDMTPWVLMQKGLNGNMILFGSFGFAIQREHFINWI